MAGIWTMGEILVEIMRPERDIPLDAVGEFRGPFPSGAPAIFIDTVARLGHPAGIIGGVGQDDFGDCVLRRLAQDGVDCRAVKIFADGTTAVAFVTYFADGSRKFLYHIDHTPAVLANFAPPVWREPPAFFHVMGCSLMANEDFRVQIIAAMRQAAQEGAQISFDPNIRPELLRGRALDAIIGAVMEQCSVLLPGVAELALISGTDDIADGARQLFARYPLRLIVLKRGPAGSTILSRGEERQDVPAYAISEVDPTGAGDCFDAAFLCGLLEGHAPRVCAQMAAAAGALNAAAFGPMEGAISREAIAAWMDRGQSMRG